MRELSHAEAIREFSGLALELDITTDFRVADERRKISLKGMIGKLDGWWQSLVLVFAKTLAGAGAATGLATGIGQGIGASAAIQAAGGLSELGRMGAAASGLGSAMAIGLVSAFGTGVLIGTIGYNSSETVQNGAQAVIGGGTDLIVNGTEAIGAWARHIDPHLQLP